jgi:hypothetical protein
LRQPGQKREMWEDIMKIHLHLQTTPHEI